MKSSEETSLQNLKHLLPILEGIETWTFDVLHDEVFKVIAELGVKNGQVLWPIRTAVSGKQFTPGGAFELADILGKEESLRRIRKGIELLENKLN